MEYDYGLFVLLGFLLIVIRVYLYKQKVELISVFKILSSVGLLFVGLNTLTFIIINYEIFPNFKLSPPILIAVACLLIYISIFEIQKLISNKDSNLIGSN